MHRILSVLVVPLAACALQVPPPLEEPRERPSHYPLITGDTFRSIAKHIYEGSAQSPDPLAIQEGDIVFVSRGYLDRFLEKSFPHIQNKFVLITTNGMGQIDSRYLPYLDDARIIAWFGRDATLNHPKLHCIPIGVSHYNKTGDIALRKLVKKYLNNLSPEDYFKEKPIHTYLNIRTFSDPVARLSIQDYFKNQPYCFKQKPKPFIDYMKDLANSRFVISPRGGVIDAFRTWETLIAGSIPVVIDYGNGKMYDELPVIFVDDYLHVSQEFLDQAFEKLKEKTFNLKKLSAQYWIDKIQSSYQP